MRNSFGVIALYVEKRLKRRDIFVIIPIHLTNGLFTGKLDINESRIFICYFRFYYFQKLPFILTIHVTILTGTSLAVTPAKLYTACRVDYDLPR